MLHAALALRGARARRARNSSSRVMRPCARVRRASTPLRIQTSSCASSLSALALIDRLLGELLLLLRLVLAEIAGVGAQLAAVEFDDAGGDAVEEGAVVGDGDDAALEIEQQVFQPLDGVQVQVVGRLVEQQHVRPPHQRLRQRHALLRCRRRACR